MKKTTLIILFFAACFGLQAQDLDHKHTDFGIKAGLNFANISTSGDVTDYDIRTSFNAGVFAHIHFAAHWAVQPELYYSGQGGKYDNGATNKGSTELNYLNVPIILQYMFGNGFRLETGPQLGFLVSAEHEVNGQETDISHNIKDLDFSWAIGASYLFPNSGFGINVRYNIGLSNVNEIEGYTFTNSVAQVGVFYHFSTQH